MKLKSKLKVSNINSVAVLSPNVTEDKFEKVITLEGSDPSALDFLIGRANDIQCKCTDTPDVIAGDLHMNSDLTLGRDGGELFRITPYAFSQLCTKLAIPTAYMKKCIESGYSELVAENVNNWLQEYSSKHLLMRKYDEVVRGILSNKYAICDTPEILSAIQSSSIVENMDLKGYLLNPHRFHARFVGEKLKVGGEDLFAGIQMDSSDVGRSKLDIKFFIWKQVCTNGLVLPQLISSIYEQKHIGLEGAKMTSEITEAFNNFSPKVKQATSILKRAVEIKLDRTQMENVANKIRTGAKIGEEAVEKILGIADEKYGMTPWGITNSITEVSQRYTLEHRLSMEKFAGSFLMEFAA